MNKISSLAILSHKSGALETKQRMMRGDDANLSWSGPRQVTGVSHSSSIDCCYHSITDNTKKHPNYNSWEQ